MRFDPDVSSGVGVIGMEFAGPGDLGSTSAVTSDDGAVLSGIAERLRAHGKTERFGVRLIRNPLGLTENELLVETCDLANRTLHCTVRKRDAIRAEDSIETTWRWKPSLSKTGPTVMQYCMAMCGYDGTGSHYPEGCQLLRVEWSVVVGGVL